MKKTLSIILIFVMLIGMMPMTAFATEKDPGRLSLEGLNVLCLGDSITAGQGLTNDTRWSNVLASKYGWNLTNKSQGGISMTSYYYTANGQTDVSIAKKAEVLKTMTTKPDVIIVWGGHNDTSYRYSPLGTWDDETTDSFKGALKYIAELADEYAPDATLFVLTPLWVNENPSTLKVPESTTDNNWMFVDAIYDGAEAYGWIPINMDQCGITPFTKSGLLLDNIHPNEAGTEKIVEYLSEELASYGANSKKETIIFNASAVSMKPGESTTLKAVLSPRSGTGTMTFTWSSSDSSVATVDTSGKITAVAPGTAVITATAPNGISADISVSVICEHDYEAVVTDPTCTEQGYTTYTCECGDSYVDDYVDATGEHTYENGVCLSCGRNDTTVELFGGFSAIDFFLKDGVLSDGQEHVVAIYSNTNNARMAVIHLIDGATYRIRVSNNGGAATKRMKICTFAERFSEMTIAPLASERNMGKLDPSVVSVAQDVIFWDANKGENCVSAYEGTFVNTGNAKTMILFTAWGADPSLVEVSVKSEDHQFDTDTYAGGNNLKELTEILTYNIGLENEATQKIMEIAKGFWEHRDEFIYCSGTALDQPWNYWSYTGYVDSANTGKTVTAENAGFKRIDCSTFVRYVINGIDYYSTPYYNALEHADVEQGGLDAGVEVDSEDPTVCRTGKIDIRPGKKLILEAKNSDYTFTKVFGYDASGKAIQTLENTATNAVFVPDEGVVYLRAEMKVTDESDYASASAGVPAAILKCLRIREDERLEINAECPYSGYRNANQICKWFDENGYAVEINKESFNFDNLRVGSVIYWGRTSGTWAYKNITHTSIYIGDGYVMHVSAPYGLLGGEGILIESIDVLMERYDIPLVAVSSPKYHMADIHPHSYETNVTAPTCTEKGYTTHTCHCGHSYVDGYTDATGHNFADWIEILAPTCTEKGSEHRECANCDHNETREVAALGHDEINHEPKAPTCTDVGWNAYKTCSRCDYSTYVEIAANGHNHEAVVTAPTCTEQGYTTYTCHCGDSYVDGYTDATGHSFGDWIETLASTCTEKGSECRDCINCDHYETREVAALGHDEINHEPKAPTCTDVGWNAYETCSRCDYSTYVEIAANGHNHEAVVTEPTCTEDGYTTHTCHCGNSYVNSYVDALGHNYDNACDTSCNVCNDVREVPAHIYDNACDTTCNVCGQVREVPDHVYDNACDTTCNICDVIRVITHDYKHVKYDDNQHWQECDCGATADIEPHEFASYDSNDTSHWRTCLCGVTQTAENHKYTHEADKICDICNAEREVIGAMLVDEDGNKVYYLNGEKQNITELVKIDGIWYYINNSVWDKTSKTLHKLAGKWFFVENGTWSARTTIVEYKGKNFYVQGGKWESRNDIVKLDGKYYFIKGGKWDKTLDSLHKLNGKWFLVKNGMWTPATRIVEYKGKMFYVKGGKWESRNDIVKLDGKYYFIKGGKWDKTKTTLFKKDGKYYAIKKGMWYIGKGIIKYNGKKYYVNKGYAQTKYSGKVTINGKKYTVKKGIIK